MILGVVLAGYLASLLVRGAGVEWTWLDGWTIVGVELAASTLCIGRGLRMQRGRTNPIVLGLSHLAWTLGEVALTAE